MNEPINARTAPTHWPVGSVWVNKGGTRRRVLAHDHNDGHATVVYKETTYVPAIVRERSLSDWVVWAGKAERVCKEEKRVEGVCGRCGYHREPGAMVCRWCVSGRAKDEKGRGNVGPHTSARASGGCACQRNHCPGCDWGTSATHHATQPTQVLENKGPDTTSHG